MAKTVKHIFLDDHEALLASEGLLMQQWDVGRRKKMFRVYTY